MRYTQSRIRGCQKKPEQEQLERSGEAHREEELQEKEAYPDNSKEQKTKIERERKEKPSDMLDNSRGRGRLRKTTSLTRKNSVT